MDASGVSVSQVRCQWELLCKKEMETMQKETKGGSGSQLWQHKSSRYLVAAITTTSSRRCNVHDVRCMDGKRACNLSRLSGTATKQQGLAPV